MNKTKSYSELITINSYIERFRYLKIGSNVGEETFGSSRYLNQILYKCPEWRTIRNKIISRDRALDLGHIDYEIVGPVYIHHINPITVEDILNRRSCVFDEDNLISTAFLTHQAIHFGDESLLCLGPTIRTPNDTIPWRKK